METNHVLLDRNLQQEEELKLEQQDNVREVADSDSNQDREEDLGSELSGASAEVPDEIVEIHRSANYLTFYARDYKQGGKILSRSKKVQL